MKKLSIVFLVTLLSVFATYANNDDNIKEEVNNKLRNKIVHLLGNYQEVLNTDVEQASIKFLINREGEIIVISVKTDKNNIENFIKSKLNYKVAEIKNVQILKTYTLPVKFVKE